MSISHRNLDEAVSVRFTACIVCFARAVLHSSMFFDIDVACVVIIDNVTSPHEMVLLAWILLVNYAIQHRSSLRYVSDRNKDIVISANRLACEVQHIQNVLFIHNAPPTPPTACVVAT